MSRHPMGTARALAESTRTRRRALLFVVLGVLAVLTVLLLVGFLEGDKTDAIDPQTGELVTGFLH